MLTIPQAAEHFSVSVATMRRWIRSGRVRSQLTLGPYGEQWMVDPNSDPGASRTAVGFVPVEQLTRAAAAPDALLQEAEQALQEAWQAREEAERELHQLRLEQATLGARTVAPAAPQAKTHETSSEEAAVCQTPADAAQPTRQAAPAAQVEPGRGAAPADPGTEADAAHSALRALRCDLEGSERERARLAAELARAHDSQAEAWAETRTALRALGDSYARLEGAERELELLRSESDWVRRALGARLGLNGHDFPLAELLLRWESFSAPRAAARPEWSRARRAGAELDADLA